MEPTTTQKIINFLRTHGSKKYPNLLEVKEESLPEDSRPDDPNGHIIDLSLSTWKNQTIECIDYDYNDFKQDPQKKKSACLALVFQRL